MKIQKKKVGEFSRRSNKIRTKKQLPCVIVDNTNEVIRHCNLTTSLISLSQLVRTWEIELTSDESLDLTDGHLYKHLGSGRNPQTCVDNELHIEDTNLVLRLFSNWLLNLSYSQNENKKEILQHMMKLLEIPKSHSSFLINKEFHSPSPLLVKIAMKINKFDSYLPTDKNFIKAEEY
ncbi:22877_t:CDS:2 [Cetraspora pellucida]|uniref:22877_t:CDS:1 n=1 Tax=Cetraspora pellucida TaxID=1433469 RepID=A0A9N9CH94_9GLOM|nr:22877_t:CDS:2 [Cetraspora pellucida]